MKCSGTGWWCGVDGPLWVPGTRRLQMCQGERELPGGADAREARLCMSAQFPDSHADLFTDAYPLVQSIPRMLHPNANQIVTHRVQVVGVANLLRYVQPSLTNFVPRSAHLPPRHCKPLLHKQPRALPPASFRAAAP